MIIKNGVGITTLKNGAAAKQALSDTSEVVAKGIYDATTLSTVDADLTAAKLESGTVFFGITGSLSAGVSFADYEYEADLAALGNYVPPVDTFFNVSAEDSLQFIRVEWWDNVNSSWDNVADAQNENHMLHQSASQRLRIYNADGVNALAIGLYGVTWSGLADLEYEADLGSGANYVPPAKSFFVWFSENIGAASVNAEWYDNVNTAWVLFMDNLDEKQLLYQGVNQRRRIINDAGSAQAVGVYGATWS